MFLVGLSPNGEKEIGRELCQVFVREGKEQLVGGTCHRLGIPLCQQDLADARSLTHGMAGQTQIKVVLHQRFKLDAQQSAFCKHSPTLLYTIAEILCQNRIGKHHRLAKERTLLGATNVEHIGQTSQQGKRNVRCRGSQAIAQTRAIDEQGQSELHAHIMNFLQFPQAVQCAKLC